MSAPKKPGNKPAQAATQSLFEREPWASLMVGFLFAGGAYAFERIVIPLFESGDDEEED